MAKKCIICGKAAGSREHIFPAGLGGRRTNKGIYCGKHNNAYSELAGVLANQLRAVNALIGVRNDHSKDIAAAVVNEIESGRSIRLSAEKAHFTDPQQLESVIQDGHEITTKMAFSSLEAANDWANAQRAQGHKIELGRPEGIFPHYVGSMHFTLSLGGPQGLQAISYLAQTYLAHYFPDIARGPDQIPFTNYTLTKITPAAMHDKAADEFVWWDFEPPEEMLQSTFDLGHRIVVGLDSLQGIPYARVSLYSALHFAIQFCPVPGLTSQAVIVDIDPLADNPPEDIRETRWDHAVAAVTRPTCTKASLAKSINNSRAEAFVGLLMQRIEERQMLIIGKRVWQKLESARDLEFSAQQASLARALDEESQSVLNTLRAVFARMEQEQPDLAWFAQLINMLLKPVPESRSGLSDQGLALLQLGLQTLQRHITKEHEDGNLSAEKLGLLLAGGPGAALLCKTIFTALAPNPR